MSRKTVFVTIISMILILCVFVGCSDSKTDELTGTWKYSFEEGSKQCELKLTFDGMGNFTGVLREGEEESESTGSYRTADGYIKLTYDIQAVKTDAKVFLKEVNVNEGTEKAPSYVYYVATHMGEGNPDPEEFVLGPFQCIGGEFREELLAGHYPIVLSYEEDNKTNHYQVSNFSSFGEKKMNAFEACNRYADDNKTIVYSFEETARGDMIWNDPDNWDWDANGISTQYVFQPGEPDNATYMDFIKYSIAGGNKLRMWWDFESGECEFTKL